MVRTIDISRYVKNSWWRLYKRIINEATIVLDLFSHFPISNESANRVQKVIENIYNEIFVKGLCDKTIDSNINLSDVSWK